MIHLKVLTGLLIIMMITSIGNAQEYYIGAMGGLNITDIKMKSNPAKHNIKSRNELSTGIVFGDRLSDVVSFELHPSFMRKCCNVIDNEQDLNFDVSMSYLELPVFFKVGVGETIRPSLYAGPVWGFLFDSNIEAKYEGLDFNANLDNILRTIDFGFGVGVSIGYVMWSGEVSLNVRYTVSGSDLYQSGEILFEADDMTRTRYVKSIDSMSIRGVQILVGYTLPVS
jgi:hypothetical protein